jgi:peroxiredoxin
VRKGIVHRARSRRVWVASALVFVGAAAAAAASFSVGGSGTPARTSALDVGATAPEFSLHAARGGTYHLVQAGVKALVLAFVDTTVAARATQDPSRSQVVFLKSMETQYSKRGLRVLIIDATQPPATSSTDSLINFTYDWQLSRIPVLADPHGATAEKYGVTGVPTTFLIRANRTIAQRWDGFASAQQLAFPIKDMLAG